MKKLILVLELLRICFSGKKKKKMELLTGMSLFLEPKNYWKRWDCTNLQTH